MQAGPTGNGPSPPIHSSSLPTPAQPDHMQWRWSSASAIMEAPSPLPNSSPVPLRVLSNTAKRRQAQAMRNSVAITSSDYYNSRRPQLALLQIPSGYRTQSAQALHTISEYEASATPDGPDRALFRYTPNAVCDPSRQSVPRPLSRTSSLSSLPGSGRPVSPNVPMLPSPVSKPSPLTTNTHRVSTVQSPPAIQLESRSQTPTGRPMSIVGIPFTESTAEQFQTLYLNRQNGRLYMLESGYYTPLSDEELQLLKRNQPPAADRRPSFRSGNQKSNTPSDYFGLSQIVMILLLLCLNLPVLLMFSIPAIIFSLKARRAYREGRSKDGSAYAEFSICLNSSAIVFHILTVIVIIAVIVVVVFVL